MASFEKISLEGEQALKPEQEELEVIEPKEIKEAKIPEINYSQEAENEIRKIKEKYGELVNKAGLSEETFDKIEIRLKETADSLQKSDNQLQESKRKSKSYIRRRVFGQITSIIAATVIGFSSIGEVKADVAFQEPTTIERVEKKSVKQEQIEWVRHLYKVMPFLQKKMGDHLPFFMKLIANDILQSDQLSQSDRLKLILSDLENFNMDIKVDSEKPSAVKEIKGFEKLVGDFNAQAEQKTIKLSSELIKEVVEKTFPNEWVGSDIESFEYLDKFAREFIKENKGILAWCKDTGYKSKAKIEFFRPVRWENPHYLLGNIMSHELAHANDWEFDNQLSAEARIYLLAKVAQRLESSDRYHSAYVESIQEKDKQYQYYKKCLEYWAEICGAYFSDPDREDLPEQDRKLIEFHLSKTTPGFDARGAKKIRDKLIQNYFRSKGVELPAHEVFVKIPPVPLPPNW